MKTHIVFSVSVLVVGLSAVVCADFPTPENVTLLTLNTNYVLKWDWRQGPNSGDPVTFTAQSIPMYKMNRSKSKSDWKTVCETTEYHCDFSAGLYYYGMWLLRVRAQNKSYNSSWVQREFCPDKDAVVGPPSAVDVTSVKGLLQVNISDPVSSNNASMRELLPHLYYYIQYWPEPLEMQKPLNLTSPNNLVILPDLERWTLYCVRVQTRNDFYKKFSVFSPVYCRQTDGQMPYWQIFLYFLLSLVLSFLFVLGLSFCILKSTKIIKSTFYPAVSLPAHIHEYLADSPGSDMPHLLTTSSEVELCCDQLDILACDPAVTAVIMEIHSLPQDSEQDSRNHTRHDSGDSGVYSAEEGLGSSQHSQGSRAGEEVKLENMGQKIFHREQDVETHERIQDMLV